MREKESISGWTICTYHLTMELRRVTAYSSWLLLLSTERARLNLRRSIRFGSETSSKKTQPSHLEVAGEVLQEFLVKHGESGVDSNS